MFDNGFRVWYSGNASRKPSTFVEAKTKELNMGSLEQFFNFDPIEIIMTVAAAAVIYYKVNAHEKWITEHEKEAKEDSESLINVENKVHNLDTTNARDHKALSKSIMPREVIETKFAGVAEKIDSTKDIIIAEIRKPNGH